MREAGGVVITETEGADLHRIYPVRPADSTEARVADPESIYDELQWGPVPDHRPYVVINMVSTVDGKVTLDHNRHREPIGSEVDRALMARLREGADAVLRGASTVRAFPYYPKAAPASLARRAEAGLEAHPLAVALTVSCDLPVNTPYFRDAPRRPVVLTAEGADPSRVDVVRDVAEVEFVAERPAAGTGEPGLDLAEALARLRSKFHVNYLVVEGGPSVNYQFLQHHLVDELFWTVAPKVGGQRDDLTMVEGPELLLPLRRLQLVTAYVHDDELFLRYRVRQPQIEGNEVST